MSSGKKRSREPSQKQLAEARKANLDALKEEAEVGDYYITQRKTDGVPSDRYVMLMMVKPRERDSAPAERKWKMLKAGQTVREAITSRTVEDPTESEKEAYDKRIVQRALGFNIENRDPANPQAVLKLAKRSDGSSNRFFWQKILSTEEVEGRKSGAIKKKEVSEAQQIRGRVLGEINSFARGQGKFISLANQQKTAAAIAVEALKGNKAYADALKKSKGKGKDATTATRLANLLKWKAVRDAIQCDSSIINKHKIGFVNKLTREAPIRAPARYDVEFVDAEDDVEIAPRRVRAPAKPKPAARKRTVKSSQEEKPKAKRAGKKSTAAKKASGSLKVKAEITEPDGDKVTVTVEEKAKRAGKKSTAAKKASSSAGSAQSSKSKSAASSARSSQSKAKASSSKGSAGKASIKITEPDGDEVTVSVTPKSSGKKPKAAGSSVQAALLARLNAAKAKKAAAAK